MKHLLAAFFLAFFFLPSAFAARPDTRKMTCRDLTALLESKRAVVLTYGNDLYDRFVIYPNMCDVGGDRPSRAFLPTLDVDRCSVGYSCFSKIWIPSKTEKSDGGGSTVIGGRTQEND